MNDTAENKVKKIKKKGPLRTEAIIPIGVILFALGFYFTTFFDSHLKAGLQWSLGHLNGAEVNIGVFKSSFINGTITIKKIEVTDKDDLEKNALEIGAINLGLLWDALLRAKFVIEEASIDQIQIQTQRKRPGKLIKGKEEDEKKSAQGQQLALQTLDSGKDVLKEELGNNILGNVIELLEESKDPKDQLKEMKNDFALTKRVKELEEDFSKKKEFWESKQKELGNPKDLLELIKSTSETKIDTNNPVAAVSQVSLMAKNVKEISTKVNDFKKSIELLKTDLGQFNGLIQELETLSKEDLKNLEGQFKIPDLNTGDLSTKIFADLFQKKTKPIQKYIGWAQKYMPPKLISHKNKNVVKDSAEVEKELLPPKRGKGQDFTYPKQKGYPFFWLKKAQISSKSNQDGFSADLSGKILDFSSTPELVKRPAEIIVEGDFPRDEIRGIKIQVGIHHHVENPYEDFNVLVSSFPLKGMNLSKSSKLNFGIEKANGHSLIQGKVQDGQFQAVVKNLFNQVEYKIESPSESAQELLRDVTQDMSKLTLDAKGSGPLAEIKWDISSNLGKALESGLKRVLEKKINEFKAKLKKAYMDQTAEVKEKLTKEFDQYQAKFKQQLDEYKGKIEGEENKLKDKLAQAQKSATSNQQQKLDKGLKDIKKKLKLKF